MSIKKNYKTKASYELPDYRIYLLSKKELFQYGLIGAGAGCVILYFFYHSIWVICMGFPCGVFFCKWQKKEMCKKRKQALNQQFRDWIHIVAAGLQAGHSIENAFLKSSREICLMYGEETDIRRELMVMERLLKNNVTLEKILEDFGERSGSEDICQFAEAFMIGKRSGGNLREIIENCCEIIAGKIEVEREIQVLIHGKVTEQKIMCVIPFGIMLYISISSPGYFTPLYHNLAGICIMTGCLILYVVAVALSLKIIKIGV